MNGRTLFEKVWQQHVVSAETDDHPAMLYVDLHLIHEVTSPQAFSVLRERGLPLRRADLTLATMDHSTPTLPVGRFADLKLVAEPSAMRQLAQLERNCRDFGVTLHGFDSEYRGIVHVIGPELGVTQPGKTIVCGDSHTSTHGALGALAFGIGSTEVGHVMATQCLLQYKPRTFAVNIEGTLRPGVAAKDIILALIGRVGVDGGVGHVIEYRGTTVRGLSIEQRMTICNMSIEAGARAGMIAPDDTTFEYLHGRPLVPRGTAWDEAVARWRDLPSDERACFDKELTLDVSALKPMVTFGTNPGMAVAIDEPVPERTDDGFRKALTYMGVTAGKPLQGHPVDVVFLGSCTNSRLSDLREAARVLEGRKVARTVRMLVVPGSEQVKRAAEKEGLDRIFRAAGAEWREAGCSMCLGMNGDTVPAQRLVVSTSNRNFEGRQGKGARTVLASPVTAAASAIAGHVADPRQYLAN
jgi:3-isopropylmalate/(R)-2-methylmalate dehydratase large subunit